MVLKMNKGKILGNNHFLIWEGGGEVGWEFFEKNILMP
jgi:hypothetical protein